MSVAVQSNVRELKSFELERVIRQRTQGRIRALRVYIVNEEEVLLRGWADNYESRELAQRSILSYVSEDQIRNDIEIA